VTPDRTLRHGPCCHILFLKVRFNILSFCGAKTLLGPSHPHFLGFEISLRHTTLGRTPLDEGSARRRDLYLTTHNTDKGHPCLPVGFEPAIPGRDRPQTYALNRAAIGIGHFIIIPHLSLHSSIYYIEYRLTFGKLTLFDSSVLVKLFFVVCPLYYYY
jgi:hypothetical protein